MSHPAANANEAFNDAKKKEEKEEIDRIINRGTNPLLVKNEWRSLELMHKLLDRSVTPDEVYEYYLIHDREPNQAVINIISIIDASNKYLYIDDDNKKSESPDYNVSIYIAMLWDVKKRQIGGIGDNSDKLSKTGDTMFGNLEMSGNKITGLSYEYPPGDLNNAASWGQVLLVLDNYIHKAGGMMTGWLGVGRGITLGDGFVKIRGRPIEDIDATNKEYVDSKTKPIIAVWAASHGSIIDGKRE
jgi:hypothetical protein